ncbi:MAG: hypothetical protein AB1586_16185 [Pseudomonadota bacterium]
MVAVQHHDTPGRLHGLDQPDLLQHVVRAVACIEDEQDVVVNGQRFEERAINTGDRIQDLEIRRPENSDQAFAEKVVRTNNDGYAHATTNSLVLEWLHPPGFSPAAHQVMSLDHALPTICGRSVFSPTQALQPRNPDSPTNKETLNSSAWIERNAFDAT